jgi:hypothetical protein
MRIRLDAAATRSKAGLNVIIFEIHFFCRKNGNQLCDFDSNYQSSYIYASQQKMHELTNLILKFAISLLFKFQYSVHKYTNLKI